MTKTFDDISNSAWAKNAIVALASRGIINGTSDTTFGPNAYITRGDFIKLLASTLGLSAKFDSNYSDVAKTDHYYEAIGTAKKLGVTKGAGSNKFNPKDKITRQDLITFTARALKIAKKAGTNGIDVNVTLARFADRKEISLYAADSFAALVKDGIIQGDGPFLHPKSNTTRAETSVILYKVLKKY